jgi:hypothetical protein
VGELRGGVEGLIVWFDCACGAWIVRRVAEEAALCSL